MVLNYQTIFKANNGFELLNHVSSKQASKKRVLNYQTIFKANHGCGLLNHVSSKQASKIIFSKTGLTKIPSHNQAYRSEEFRTCRVVLRYHSCILDFPGCQT